MNKVSLFTLGMSANNKVHLVSWIALFSRSAVSLSYSVIGYLHVQNISICKTQNNTITMNPRRYSEGSLVAQTSIARSTRVIINMTLDITVVLFPTEEQYDFVDRAHLQFFSTERAAHQVTSKKLFKERRYNSLSGIDKINKASKTSRPDKKRFVFIDEVDTFKASGKTMVETCDHNKKKSIPGLDELSKMFTFK
jgi:hypothetical protein